MSLVIELFHQTWPLLNFGDPDRDIVLVALALIVEDIFNPKSDRKVVRLHEVRERVTKGLVCVCPSSRKGRVAPVQLGCGVRDTPELAMPSGM